MLSEGSSLIVSPTNANLDRAAAALARGELVGLPTETVYGLAANATDPLAVEKIFTAKGRPTYNPLIVHVAGVDAIAQVINLPDGDRRAVQLSQLSAFWPGPLTVVGPRTAAIPDVVTAGRDTVAVRIPNHPVALELLRRCPFPVAAPSANVSNYISPTRAEHVRDGLGSAVAMILDGGDCEWGIESTIVALGVPSVQLLRPGAVTVEQLAARLGISITVPTPANSQRDLLPRAPGMLPSHYAPTTPLRLSEDVPFAPAESIGSRDKTPAWGRIAFAPISAQESAQYRIVEVLSECGDLDEVARELFSALRRLDSLGLDLIVIDVCAETGIGRAIMDRIRRAARQKPG